MSISLLQHKSIFAYGQTGTGKTWSSAGKPGAKRGDVPDLRGVIPRACEAIFSHMDENSSPEITFKVRVSYLEIYNEKIRDLLADPKAKSPKDIPSSPRAKGIFLREAASGEVLVEGGRKWVDVTSDGQCVDVLEAGMLNRSVGSTAMNAESSRSHAIFTLEMSQISAETMKERKSQLHLVDLAGSERQKSTHAEGERLKESNQINKSLTSLGNVIQALVDASQKGGSKRASHIPYRDSKLTFLLKDALGGNSKTCLIATVSPAESSLSETSSTLEFAKRCSAIKNAATINENLTSDVKELQGEIRRLRKLVHHLEDSGQIAPGISKRHSIKRPSEVYEIVAFHTDRVDVPSALEKERLTFSNSEKARSDEETERADRLQAITADALAREEVGKSNLRESEAKFAALLGLVEKQEKMTSALRSVVELRDGELQQLRDGSWSKDASVRRLRREIELTKVQRDNHPEITRLSIELSESRANEVKHEIQGTSDFEKQLGTLSRELEAALVENGALRELATPRSGTAASSPFAASETSDTSGGAESIARGSSVSGLKWNTSSSPASLHNKYSLMTTSRESQPHLKQPFVSRQESMARGERLKDLLSTLRVSVHNLEESITSATNTPRSVMSNPMSTS